MNYLVIDTTSQTLFVGVFANGKRYYKLMPGLKFHNNYVMDLIDAVLKQSGTTIDDISVIAAVTGPGSYTGIRLGVTIANAIAFAQNAKRIDISALACVTPLTSDKYSVGIFAREGNYYYADFENGKMIIEGDIDEEDALKKDCFIIKKEYDPDLIFEECDRKIARSEYALQLYPKYLKRAQAERLKDRK